MKKKLIYILTICLMIGIMCGCENTDKKDGTQKIVCTTFPIYDWINNIVGEDNEKFEVILLLDNGVDMHSFQPSAKDIALISDSDIIVYVGGESEKWLEDAFATTVNKEQKRICLMEVLGELAKKEDEIVIPSADSKEEDKHEHPEEEAELDEHVWLSLNNAILFVNEIAKIICDADGDAKEEYLNNANKYCESLAKLNNDAIEKFKSVSKDTIVVADRFPFRYLVDDYSIKYYAAFPGCSAETEASFEIVVFLSGKINDKVLRYVITTESADKKMAETVIANTKDKNQEIVTLDSMQSMTIDKYKSGMTYYSIMKENLDNLVKVLQ